MRATLWQVVYGARQMFMRHAKSTCSCSPICFPLITLFSTYVVKLYVPCGMAGAAPSAELSALRC